MIARQAEMKQAINSVTALVSLYLCSQWTPEHNAKQLNNRLQNPN
jgi:hypothetical protein